LFDSRREEAGLLEDEGALQSAPPLVLPRHLSLGARPPHELRHDRDVKVERSGGRARIGASPPHLGLGGRRDS
jgi:hypothetical protein